MVDETLRDLRENGVNRLRSMVFVIAISLFIQAVGVAEEPAERFLSRLREASLFRLGSVYLDKSAEMGLLSDSMKEDLPLEKLLLLQGEIGTIRSPEERAQRMLKLEAGFREFLLKNPQNRRRSEVRIQLADLLLKRGQDLVRKSAAANEEPTAAREVFVESRKLFDGTIEELRPLLENLQGNKADTAAKEALRDRMRSEYRQSEILKAVTAKFLAETYAEKAAERKQWLEKSETELLDLVRKASGGSQVLGRLYLGQVQTLAGKFEEAFDQFDRVAAVEDSGPFREWRVQALAAQVRLQSKMKEPKYEPVLLRAEGVLKTAQSSEKWTSDWIDLQLAMAEGQVAWMALLEAQGAGPKAKSLKSEARSTLQAIAKRPGPHVEKAKQLLGSLGVEVAAKGEEKIPDVKKFSEGLAAARDRFDRFNSMLMSNEILRNRKKVAPEAEQQTIEKDIVANEQAALGDVRAGEEILMKTIPLFTKSDDKEDLAQARKLLAFALLKREAYWESAAIADFVTRTTGEKGLESGRIAMHSYEKLMRRPEAKDRSLAKPLESLAEYMLSSWPNAKESEDAAMTLIQLAADDNRWDDVQKAIDLLPKEGAKSSQIKREIGVILYARYLIEADKKRKANEPLSENDKSSLARSESLLEAGWNGLSADALDQRAVECGNALASIYLKSGRLKEAQSILQKKDVGPSLRSSRPLHWSQGSRWNRSDSSCSRWYWKRARVIRSWKPRWSPKSSARCDSKRSQVQKGSVD